MNHLYRSYRNRILLGVCGGIGEYFNVDATLIRLIWLILTVCTFAVGGVVCYIIAGVIIPPDPY
jgi:phage shock protein PspC (stress-responsive transcriptional regulator)